MTLKWSVLLQSDLFIIRIKSVNCPLTGVLKMPTNTINSSFYGNAIAPSSKLTSRYAYDADNRLQYAASAVPGSSESSAGWLIVKMAYDGSGNLASVKHPNATADFSFAWSDREGYTYN